MRFIEDVFVDFYNLAMTNGIPIQNTDRSPSRSFFNLCLHQKALTEKQAKFILRLLDKYQSFALTHGLDYSAELTSPTWRTPFRTIDDRKIIFIEYDEDNMPYVCFKFPYNLIESFEKNIVENTYRTVFADASVYDKDRKVRMVPLHDLNIILVNEFAKNNGFDLDNSFQEYLSYCEEVWNNEENYMPCASIENQCVVLNNATKDADEQIKNYDNLAHSMFKAKTMGYPLQIKPNTAFEKICSSDLNTFSADSWKDLLELGTQVPGLVVIILSTPSREHVEEIIASADASGIPRQDLRVCFRKDTDDQFTAWIHDQGVTGPVKGAKYLIFVAKPAKWLFKDNIDVSIIATDAAYMHSNSLTKNWFEYHPCVIYVSDKDIGPKKGKYIVNL